MKELWQTAPLFAAILPAMAEHDRNVRWHYADLADMKVSAEKPESAWYHDAWDNDSHRGTRDMQEAMDMARAGWPDGAEQARALRDGVTAERPVRNKLARYDVAGAVPSVARAIAGNPLNMRRVVVKESARMPTLTLVCDISVSWGFAREDMLAQASATAAVVDLLEDAGYRCEVIVVARTAKNEVGAEIAVCMKRAGDVCNLAAMAFGLGHAATFRRLFFATLFAESKVKKIGAGLGFPEKCKPAPELGTFTIPSGQTLGSGLDAKRRFAAICRKLREQGCPGIPAEV